MSRTSRAHLIYEVVMAVLALATIVLSVRPQTKETELAIAVIWGAFVADYVVRLVLAPTKWRFIRENWLDLIAIIPIGLLRGARLLRLVRVLRVFRGMAVLWRVSATVRGVLRTNQLSYVLLFTLAVVTAAGVAIQQVEPEIGTLPDCLWWSLVTATTVGYGDMAPKTLEGRGIAALLMLTGIGTIGMITGSMATYFIGMRGSRNPHIQHLQRQLDAWDSLDANQRHEIIRVLQALHADGPVPDRDTHG